MQCHLGGDLRQPPVCAGMFFVQGLENVLRGNPSFWIQWIAAPGSLAVAFFLYRKVVRAIPYGDGAGFFRGRSPNLIYVP